MIPSWRVVAFALFLPGALQDKRGEHVVFCFGQVGQAQLEVGARTTVLEAVALLEPTGSANLGAVALVRMDPQDPLVVQVNVPDMVLTGNTIANLELQPGDMLWIPEWGREEERSRPEVHKAAALVAPLSNDADPVARAMAALDIGALGEAAAPAVPHLLLALRQEPLVAREAVTALGMIGPAARAAIPVLETLTSHQDTQIAARAKVALRQVNGR